VLALFSIGLAVFEMPREKKHKTQIMEERLDAYAELANACLSRHYDEDSIVSLLPGNLRLTVIDQNGNVLYDNRLDTVEKLENHADRPEIIAAKNNGTGSNIRLSASTSKEYLYYAKKIDNRFVRVAMPYDIQLRYLLRPDSAFLYYLLILFLLGIIFVYYTANHFGLTIKQLSDFSDSVNKNIPVEIPNFSNDEIGKIGRQIAERYQKLKDGELKLTLEHEKLQMHIQSSAEGICFFTPDRKISFYNGLFLQYLNVISDNLTSDASEIFIDENFAKILNFLNNNEEKAYFETSFKKHAKVFVCRVNIFDDESFEIVLNDRTAQAKNQQLKQELTGNIAHELRTPVTGIRGYLETILENQLPKDKEREFIAKAHEQIITLSELIRDMSLLAKINERPDSFELKPVNLQEVIKKVKSDTADILKAKNIVFHSNIDKKLNVLGNISLLYSVFRNLTDNVANHAGENLTIELEKYNQEGTLAYFSFADNGTGIADEKHFVRLFERFYRVEEGRTRDTGGSGLGLSIVKNVISFHNGTISVKNRKNGGLEFLFTLPMA
jgi:signal transduction histidine kinase